MSDRIPPDSLCYVACKVLLMILRADSPYAKRKWAEIEQKTRKNAAASKRHYDKVHGKT